jgi:FSR family fosmidomycin resistance protein-like MFS transporter
MMIIFGITFFRAIMKSSLTTFLPTYINGKGESLWFAGVSLSVLELAGVFGTFFAGVISDFFGRRRLLMIVSIVTPILMYLFVHSTGYATFPILVIMGFFIFASSPIILAIVMDNSSDRPSFVNSMYMTINFAGTSVAALLVGYLADRIGLELTYEISAFIALGAIPFTLLLPDKK